MQFVEYTDEENSHYLINLDQVCHIAMTEIEKSFADLYSGCVIISTPSAMIKVPFQDSSSEKIKEKQLTLYNKLYSQINKIKAVKKL